MFACAAAAALWWAWVEFHIDISSCCATFPGISLHTYNSRAIIANTQQLSNATGSTVTCSPILCSSAVCLPCVVMCLHTHTFVCRHIDFDLQQESWRGGGGIVVVCCCCCPFCKMFGVVVFLLSVCVSTIESIDTTIWWRIYWLRVFGCVCHSAFGFALLGSHAWPFDMRGDSRAGITAEPMSSNGMCTR
jgi:hypothetical protein